MPNNGETLGSYVIESLISNQGGMSQVYLAHLQEQPDLQVALKIQRDDEKDGMAFRDLLRKEANLLNKLRHPGIVRILPIVLGDRVLHSARYAGNPPRWYYAMEYIQGVTLHKYIHDRSGRFSFRTKQQASIEWEMELFYQLAVTLKFMHDQGYAHCDLKPENILLRESPQPDRIPQPVLVDFGSACQKEGLRRAAASVGYSPPEVIAAMNRNDVAIGDIIRDPLKIDIWSLGALMYEILTGQQLIKRRERNKISSTMIQRGEFEYTPITQIRSGTHRSLDIFLKKLIHARANERPTIDEVIQVLETKISSIRPPRIKTKAT